MCACVMYVHTGIHSCVHLQVTSKCKCLDRNRPREEQLSNSPMTLNLGSVTASFGDVGRLLLQCTTPGLARPAELALDVRVLSMQLCFVWIAKGETEAAAGAVGSTVQYSNAQLPGTILLQLREPRTGEIEPLDKTVKLTLKRPTATDFVRVELKDGVSGNLVQRICPQIQQAPGTYVATSDDGMLSATMNVKILPMAPANLLIRNAGNLSLKMGKSFDLGFDVLDARDVAYSDPSTLRILLQSSDGNIEFDPPPDDEDGTVEICKSAPGSAMGLFYIRSSLVGRLPPSRKMTLTVMLQGRQTIKRTVPVTMEAGEATRFVFTDAAGSVLAADAGVRYTSGAPLGLYLQAVDDSGNKVSAFSAQKAVVNLSADVSGGDAAGSAREIQVDMVDGVGDLSTERWFVSDIGACDVRGEVTVKAVRNAGLAGARLACVVSRGAWLAEVRVCVCVYIYIREIVCM